MYCLMNEVESGIDPMRESLEFHITQDGLADMEACADTITTVRVEAYANLSIMY